MSASVDVLSLPEVEAAASADTPNLLYWTIYQGLVRSIEADTAAVGKDLPIERLDIGALFGQPLYRAAGAGPAGKARLYPQAARQAGARHQPQSGGAGRAPSAPPVRYPQPGGHPPDARHRLPGRRGTTKPPPRWARRRGAAVSPAIGARGPGAEHRFQRYLLSRAYRAAPEPAGFRRRGAQWAVVRLSHRRAENRLQVDHARINIGAESHARAQHARRLPRRWAPRRWCGCSMFSRMPASPCSSPPTGWIRVFQRQLRGWRKASSSPARRLGARDRR